LRADERLVLVSFGGYGIQRINQDALDRLQGYRVIGSRAQPLDENAMYQAGLRYEDVVRAVDVVVTKPGYGIISECIANNTAVLYTSRGHFIEYDVLVGEMPRYLRCAFIPHDELFAGEWKASLDRLLTQPEPPRRPAVNGAHVVANHLFDIM
jgi:L-arabinokinase